MNKSELRKIIKNSIVELMTEKKVSKTKRGGDPCACSSDSDCKDAVASGCNGNKCRDSKCVADGNKTKDLKEITLGCDPSVQVDCPSGTCTSTLTGVGLDGVCEYTNCCLTIPTDKFQNDRGLPLKR